MKSILILSAFEELESRISGRYEHALEEIPKRIETMRNDLRYLLSQKTLTDYDFILQNPNSSESIGPLLKRVKEIIEAERANLITNEKMLNSILGTYKESSESAKAV